MSSFTAEANHKAIDSNHKLYKTQITFSLATLYKSALSITALLFNLELLFWYVLFI